MGGTLIEKGTMCQISTWHDIKKIQVKTRTHTHIPGTTGISLTGGKKAKQYNCLGKRQFPTKLNFTM